MLKADEYKSHSIDDGARSIPRWPEGVNYISFVNSSNHPFDEDRLRAALSASPGRNDIRGFCITASSRLTSAWPASVFPNVTDIYLAGYHLTQIEDIAAARHLDNLMMPDATDTKSPLALPVLPARLKRLVLDNRSVRDLAPVESCQSLDEFVVRFARFTGLRELRRVRASKIRIVYGTVNSIAGLNRSVKELDVLGCRNLVDLGGCTAAQLMVDGSTSDMDSLVPNRDLRSLTVRSHKRIQSLHFISGCQRLRHFAMLASRVANKELNSIADSRSLNAVCLSQGFSSKVIRELSTKNRRIVVTNLTKTYRAGKEIDMQQYYQAVRKVLNSIP